MALVYKHCALFGKNSDNNVSEPQTLLNAECIISAKRSGKCSIFEKVPIYYVFPVFEIPIFVSYFSISLQ